MSNSLLKLQPGETQSVRLVLEAVKHWLFEFPNCGLSKTLSFRELILPHNIYQIFMLLLNQKDFACVSAQMGVDISKLFAVKVTPEKNTCGGIVLPVRFLRQVECIDRLAQSHLKAAESKSGVAYSAFASVNWFQMCLSTNQDDLCRLLRLILVIGTQTSKMSTFGLSSLSFLGDNDREHIVAFMKVESQPGNSTRALSLFPNEVTEYHNRVGPHPGVYAPHEHPHGQPRMVPEEHCKMLSYKIDALEQIIRDLTSHRGPYTTPRTCECGNSKKARISGYLREHN